jgi:hypothetical protein
VGLAKNRFKAGRDSVLRIDMEASDFRKNTEK